MRNVSVVFRILLLPIFLVRFCLPRPPETVPKRLNNFGSDLHAGIVRFQKRVNETHFTELEQNENDETMLLNTDPKEFEKFEQNVRLLKMKRENFVEGHSFKEVQKTEFSAYTRDMDKLNRDKQLHLFGTNGNVNDNQSIEAILQKRKQTAPLSKLHFKGSLSKEATENKIEKASTLKVERLPDLQINSSGHSAVTYRERGITRFRTKRSVNETIDSTRFEQAPSRTTPPEYMVHLFQLLSGTQYETLRNFVVTGFVNVNKDTDSSVTFANVTTQSHKLIFEVNIPYETETIHYAELRLYFVHLRHNTADKCGSETTDHQNLTYNIRIFDKNELVDSKLIAEKTVTNVQNSWVSFNLTAAVQTWMISGLRAIEIATTFCGNCTNPDSKSSENCQGCSGNCSNDLVVNLNHDQGKGPILVMFSRKSEIQMEVPHRREVRDTLSHTGHLQLLTENPKLSNKDNDYNKDASSGHLYFQGLVEFISATSTNAANSLQSSNFASLKDFVWPTNMANQQNDTDKDNSQTQNETYNSTFLNLKDNERLTVNISSTHQPSQRQSPTNTEAGSIKKHLTFLKEHRLKTLSRDDDSSKLSDDTLRMKLRRDTTVRYRRHLDGLFKRKTDNPVSRHKRSKKKRVSCQRNEMYVDFETIKWDKVIIFPRGYQAFECVGKCYTPINEYLTPTKHAIIQTLVHTSYPDQASRACCVPTKLDPISILYWDDNGDIKYDYTYEGMVVAECGCR